MGSVAARRLTREYKEVVESRELREMGLGLSSPTGELRALVGEVRGPPDTPYAGGTFRLDLAVPESYPFRPPAVRFITRVWHPNISSATGAVCLDVLGDAWAASMTLRTVLISVQALLGAAEPKDPQDAVVARQRLEAPELFAATARLWAQLYAAAPGQPSEEQRAALQSLQDKGVSLDAALTALSAANFRLPDALKRLQ